MAEGKNWFQKGWSGATRAAGGTADWVTGGLTDFDKRGSANYQFGPIGGGENKRWETGAEKREAKAKKAAADQAKIDAQLASYINLSGPIKEAAPDKLPNNLRYPYSTIDSDQDYVQFSIFKYKRSGMVTRANEELKDDANLLGTIILPIPSQLQDQNAVKYGESGMNFLQEGVINAGKGLMAGGGEAAGKAVNNMIAIATGNSDIVQNYFATKAVNTIGGNLTVDQVLARSQGEIINPNQELLFSGVTLRTFNFTFKFTPRFQKEADVIRTIIKAFKRNMAPKGIGSAFLETPNIFDIQYIHRGKPHPYLNRIKMCALKTASVNYTGDGNYTTYVDGAPISSTITLGFNELTPIYNEDYEAYDDNKDGVGY